MFINFLGRLRPVAAYTWSRDPIYTTEKTDGDEVLPAWLNSSAILLRPQDTQDNIEYWSLPFAGKCRRPREFLIFPTHGFHKA